MNERINHMQERKKGRYRHFKGMEYQLLYTARHSETQEEMIVYRALYGDGGIWVRPASMWDEMVERGGMCCPRFQWIAEMEPGEDGSGQKQTMAEEGSVCNTKSFGQRSC
jgi:hypothetical protein